MKKINDVIDTQKTIMDGVKAISTKLTDKNLHELIQYLIDIEVKRKDID